MHALETPPVWWTHVAVAFDGAVTASPEGLVLGCCACSISDSRDFGGIVVVVHRAATVGVFDLRGGMTSVGGRVVTALVEVWGTGKGDNSEWKHTSK
jgi:hypothetical protein